MRRHSSWACVFVSPYLEMSPSISDWISMISDLVKTCGVLSSNIELSVCTKTRRVWIVKAASSRGCPPVSADCRWFCLALFLISLNIFLWHWLMYLQGQEQHNEQMCGSFPSQYKVTLYYAAVCSAMLILNRCHHLLKQYDSKCATFKTSTLLIDNFMSPDWCRSLQHIMIMYCT